MDCSRLFPSCLLAKARAELDPHVAGHHLKGLRKAIGKTQQEPARELGVSHSRISQMTPCTATMSTHSATTGNAPRG